MRLSGVHSWASRLRGGPEVVTQPRTPRVSIAYVSRILWVGVGAAGGIYVYRKTTQTIEGVRERTVRENLTRIAKHASNVAASARYLAALNGDDEQPEGVVDIRKASGGR